MLKQPHLSCADEVDDFKSIRLRTTSSPLSILVGAKVLEE